MPLPPHVQGYARDSADDIERIGRQLAETHVATATDFSVAGWRGLAAVDYAVSQKKLQSRVLDFAKTLAVPIAALRDWAETNAQVRNFIIPELWERYNDAERECARSLAALQDDVSFAENSGSFFDVAEIDAKRAQIVAARAQAQQVIIAEYKKVMARLDDEAGRAGAEIQRSSSQVFSRRDPGYVEPEAPGKIGDGYTLGPPQDRTIPHDDDYPFESQKGKDTVGDHVAWAKWGTLLTLGKGRPDLDDASPFYEHYRSAAGTPKKFDYDEAYREDEYIRRSVDDELNKTKQVAQELVEQGKTSAQFSSDTRAFKGQPQTENWQKTIGAHHYWSDSEMSVDGDTVTLRVKVNAADYYNFNKGAHDVGTRASDNENGRFQALGWARGFPTSGELVREYRWKIGEEPPSDPSAGTKPDNEDHRGNSR
ncbi:MAG: hypothetical protein CSA82_03555 [Actinobacteria bacterium]|nr:MAG: hypothetical protein CSA82_03555 [Actinomycetota bacterium]